MSNGSAGYCTRCGAALVGSGRFCTTCGAPRPSGVPQGGASAAAPAPRPSVNAAGSIAAAASMATGLPWQTIVAGQVPDLSSMLARVAMPTAQKVVNRSLRRPGLALAVTTVLDLFVAGITGGGTAVSAAIPRVIGGGATALLSMITGSKGGALRGLTGIISLLTALVQVFSLLVTFVSGLRGGAPLITLAPMAIATGSATVMALKTASVALRRRS